MSLKTVAAKVSAFLKREPVAVWGVVLGAVVNALPLAGVDAHVTEVVASAITLAGIPLVRNKVSPVVLVKALLEHKVPDSTAPASSSGAPDASA